ncbi:hypothetical protein CWI39_0284p0010 [Hamiltosporidium magnivora]|uniref:Leucine-rich repeat-containing protein n=1 Tax=Hamiltosporidium magnivora TaxID=148818 RepID=A0A4Q9LIP2_9MICR|nr:hypothetical protein CWI39_0284p0010 [Hamiltosporidium magnivora]
MKVSDKNTLIKFTFNVNFIYMCVLFFLIENLKAENNFIFHFYNEEESNLKCDKEHEMPFSKFIKQRYNCLEHKECSNCIKHIITDVDKFSLNFDIKEEEKSEYTIYISKNVLNYDDFRYFLRIIREINDIKENFRIVDCLRLIHIFDIFKFKKDKNFYSFIRILLLSTIYNSKNMYERLDIIKKLNTSSSLFESILYEICNINFFDGKPFLLNILKYNGNEEITEYLSETISTKSFVNIRLIFLNRICKRMKYNHFFRNTFKLICKVLGSRKVLLNLENSKEVSLSFSMFKMFLSSEVICFYNWRDIKFLQSIIENCIFKNIKSLIFINCLFSSLNESVFENFTELKSIYLFDCSTTNTIFSHKIYNFMKYIVCGLYDEIYNEEKIRKFMTLTNNRYCEPKKINVQSCVPKIKGFYFHDIFDSEKYKIISFDPIVINKSFVTLKTTILNHENFSRAYLILKEALLMTLKFQNTLVKESIRNLYIYNSKLTNEFLFDILLLPNLQGIQITDSTFIFDNYKFKYSEHLLMQELFIVRCESEESDDIFEFINSMPNLKSLKLTPNRNISLFKYVFKYNMMKLKNLEKFEFEDENKCDKGYSNSLYLGKIIGLEINCPFEQGFLYTLFSNQKVENLKKILIYNCNIGLKDKNSMRNYTRIQSLSFTNIKLFGISFCELFDMQKEYMIQDIYISDVKLSKRDLTFISNLKYLRFLFLRTTDEMFDCNDWFQSFHLNPSKVKIEICFANLDRLNKNRCKEIYSGI